MAIRFSHTRINAGLFPSFLGKETYGLPGYVASLILRPGKHSWVETQPIWRPLRFAKVAVDPRAGDCSRGTPATVGDPGALPNIPLAARERLMHAAGRVGQGVGAGRAGALTCRQRRDTACACQPRNSKPRPSCAGSSPAPSCFFFIYTIITTDACLHQVQTPAPPLRRS